MEQRSDEHESDITSQDPSIQTPSPQRNGSVTNPHTPGQRSNNIRTITQSASRGELNRAVAGSSRSPAAIPKQRLEHVPNRCQSNGYFDKNPPIVSALCVWSRELIGTPFDCVVQYSLAAILRFTYSDLLCHTFLLCGMQIFYCENRKLFNGWLWNVTAIITVVQMLRKAACGSNSK